jgi:hypothetical protein
MPAGKSGIAAGAQAGAAFGPWGAAIGGALGGVTDMMGQAMGGPTVATAQTDARSFMDGSGWTVSTGGSRSTGGARSGGPDMSSQATPQRGQAAAYAPTMTMGGADLGSPWLWLLIAAGAGIFLAKG